MRDQISSLVICPLLAAPLWGVAISPLLNSSLEQFFYAPTIVNVLTCSRPLGHKYNTGQVIKPLELPNNKNKHSVVVLSLFSGGDFGCE